MLSCALPNIFTTELFHKMADTIFVLYRDLTRSCMMKKAAKYAEIRQHEVFSRVQNNSFSIICRSLC